MDPIKPRRKPLFEMLSRDTLARIAYHLVVDDNGIGRHPSVLIPLLLTNKIVYDAIAFDNNPQLYNNLYRATFDYAALIRRYEMDGKSFSRCSR